ncbi:MAG: hypothetical protein ABS62_04825 [Microbacterium sp. SCN 70-200]|uniref:hypothetical protein n=1 Tax=unclassified Microbacterium TaxID=2609290 RepID=UPI00086F30D8|nr:MULTISPECIES: hypothetical protein [unclassified Microbacterium]MBN9215535.1 hypothetical protein [Microbacterium sp.]ODT42077.1 MAG: hypothetical protein ABS62_04825 [Microbacterium sp. SCN 70-200]OJV79561.1 MAG: hypothetical protein BGO46_04475 [Microbacterium sp. 70-16]
MSITTQDPRHEDAGRRPKIAITIDGARFTTRDDDQEAASLLRLAGRDPKSWNLARLVPSGEPQRFKDGKVIDLRDGDAFISVKQRVELTIVIDGESFTTKDDDQEAAALLRLAGLNPNEYDLARVRDGEEPKVYKDTKIVELRDGDVFVSVKQSSPVA